MREAKIAGATIFASSGVTCDPHIAAQEACTAAPSSTQPQGSSAQFAELAAPSWAAAFGVPATGAKMSAIPRRMETMSFMPPC